MIQRAQTKVLASANKLAGRSPLAAGRRWMQRLSHVSPELHATGHTPILRASCLVLAKPQALSAQLLPLLNLHAHDSSKDRRQSVACHTSARVMPQESQVANIATCMWADYGCEGQQHGTAVSSAPHSSILLLLLFGASTCVLQKLRRARC
jgi:hypothetical protein